MKTEEDKVDWGLIYKPEIEKHRDWLHTQDSSFLEYWNKLFETNPEAAISEAVARLMLEANGIEVRERNPYEGGPDFLCSKNKAEFYVEVTCIMIEAASRETGLQHPPDVNGNGGCYKIMTEKIRSEIANKTGQCSNLGKPCLLILGTFHCLAGMVCIDRYCAEMLLTGTPFITWSIGPQGGPSCEPYQATDLHDAAYIRPNKNGPSLEHCRQPISATVLCRFAERPPKAFGVLHPNPNHPFDLNLMPHVPFCYLKKGYGGGKLAVEWNFS